MLAQHPEVQLYKQHEHILREKSQLHTINIGLRNKLLRTLRK